MTARHSMPGQAQNGAPSYAPGGAHISNPSFDHDAADTLSLVIWSLFIAIVFLLSIIGILAIRLFE